MKIGRYLPIVLLICIGLAFATADAQENLAQEVSAIFQQSCLNCHGPSGSFKEALLIDRTALIDSQVVIPGNPENSEFYKRLLGPTENGPQMPLNLPPLSQEAIETIARWITVGAPDWNVQHDINFITTDTILDTIRAHLESLDPFDRPSARYFTMTHLYNAGESSETLSDYRIALSKLVNSLSWKFEITNPTPIDEAQTIFHIDLRRYEWNTTTEVWPQIEQVYPYNIAYDPKTQAGLFEKLTQLQTETGSTVPFVHLDWFLATASLPPLYHDILDLPQTDRILETQLGVNVASNITNAPGIDVWRAGFNDSGVSRHNRVVERHTSRYGAYWKSYDFAGSAESQNIFTYPLDFTHDGGEIIFNLPNGLQAYLLVDANGNRLDDAPIDIVSNPAASDPTVRNGLSCIGCHTQGMKIFKDSVRAAIEQDDNPPYNKEHALRLYPEQSVLDDLLQKDMERFQQALGKIGGPFADDASRQRFFKQHENEPVQRFHELFQAPLSASHAAAAVGLETEAFLTQIRKKQSLKNLGLQTLIDTNGTVKRDAWTSNFADMISALNTPDSTLPPVAQRPELIPGESVDIPDPNLRAAIAEALRKASSAAITVEDMATLTELHAEHMGIRDVTGLQFATNLTVLEIRNNLITDLSPIAGLTQLSLLRVAANKISDISSLRELINVSSLEIYGNEISDISPLGGLTNIFWLSMYNNPVSDLSPLANLKHLRGMRVSVKDPGDLSPIAELTNLEDLFYWGEGDPVPDLSPLTNLPKLRFIDIRGSGEPDLSPLAQVGTLERFEFWGSGETGPDLSSLVESINLKELWVINCGVTDLTFLENFTSLERLNLERNNISDVSPLAGLTNLKWLKLTHNPIIDFSPLEVLSQNTNILTGEVAIPDPNLRAAIAKALGKGDTIFVSITAEEMATLQKLDAPNKNISDLTGLAFATNLIELYLHDNPLSDISPLASLTKLRELHFPDTEVADLSPLSELRELEVINASETRITSLAPLAGLKSLQKLDTVHSDITDLSPLSGLTNLTRLRLYDCRATDLSPLKGLTKLKWFGLTHTDNISDLSPLSGLTDLEHLALSDTEISDISPLSGLVNLETLILNENRIADVSPLASLPNLKNLQLHNNNISDFSPLDRIRQNIEVFTWFGNPGFPQGGPNIEGPWLWLTLPVKVDQPLVGHLAGASNGKSTEEQVATLGATEGTVIGDSVWSVGTLEPYDSNKHKGNVTNLRRLLDSHGAIELNIYGQKFVVYGSMILYSPRTQQTKIFIGASNNQKVYLNGKLVHEDYTDYAFGEHNAGYRTFFLSRYKRGKMFCWSDLTGCGHMKIYGLSFSDLNLAPNIA